MVNAQFKVEGPPYPTNRPFYQTEAIKWFLYNPEKSLPYRTNEASIELVKSIYAAGAVRVEVVVENANSDPSVNELEVFPPIGDTTKRARLIAMVREEGEPDMRPDMNDPKVAQEVKRAEAEFSRSNSPDPLMLWWD